MVGEDRVELSPRVPKTRMLALHHTPICEIELVRQVRLELTLPCLRGRYLDPVWLLTHGGTERTRTVIGLVDNQVPHLSATVPCENNFGSACRIRTGDLLIESQVAWANLPNAPLVLGGLKRLELSPAAVTVRRSTI